MFCAFKSVAHIRPPSGGDASYRSPAAWLPPLAGSRLLPGRPVLRLMGLHKLPDVATISRALSQMESDGVDNVRKLLRSLVIEGLHREQLPRLTLDFDGSVQSTNGHAEGTAVGYNKNRKGARSYYPLFCTVAQTGQFFDLHHRPGNVPDSNGAA